MFSSFVAKRHISYLRSAGKNYQKQRRTDAASANALIALGITAAASLALITQKDKDNDITSPSSLLLPTTTYCQSLYYHQHTTSKDTDDPSSPSSAKNKPFQLKQEYEIQQLLGEGAYGMVFSARRKADDKLVALKTMPREFTGQTDFEREVAALQLLQRHDHIVQFYDLHRDERNYYLAMELIDGGEIYDHLIENGPYSESEARDFLRQFAEAICFVHKTGLTHNDLKPENLMIHADTKLKLVDFGCARSHKIAEKNKDMLLSIQEFAQGCSFLHQVARGVCTNNLQLLLDRRPDLVQFQDYDRRTALHIASSEGNYELCDYLIEHGAGINRSDRWGGHPLDDAYRHGHTNVMHLLRRHGGRFGNSTAIHLITAASNGDAKTVQTLLELGNNTHINQGDYDHRTALHLAAAEGHSEIVRLLCDAGANVNAKDRWGNYPIDEALSKNATNVVEVLTKYGAVAVSSGDPDLTRPPTAIASPQDATMRDLKNRSQTDKSSPDDQGGMSKLSSQDFAMGCSVLHQAALGNQFEMETILQDYPDLVNFRDYDRRTALHVAASEGHLDICRYLVAKGGILNRSDRWGGSPLDDAHRQGHTETVQFLSEQGAQFGSASQIANFITAASEGDTEEVQAFLNYGGFDVNVRDYDHRTALHLAAAEGHYDIVQLLCEAGANVNVEDRWGNRPLDDARDASNNSKKNHTLLVQYGAQPSVLSTSTTITINRSQNDGVMATEEEIEDGLSQDCHSCTNGVDAFPGVIGTVAYSPPEVFLQKGATSSPAMDMWATGVIMYILLTGT